MANIFKGETIHKLFYYISNYDLSLSFPYQMDLIFLNRLYGSLNIQTVNAFPFMIKFQLMENLCLTSHDFQRLCVEYDNTQYVFKFVCVIGPFDNVNFNCFYAVWQRMDIFHRNYHWLKPSITCTL